MRIIALLLLAASAQAAYLSRTSSGAVVGTAASLMVDSSRSRVFVSAGCIPAEIAWVKFRWTDPAGTVTTRIRPARNGVAFDGMARSVAGTWRIALSVSDTGDVLATTSRTLP